MLKSLHLRHVGSAPQLDMELADRLNIITGDNGLGKSFLLDVAWWTLTGTWVDQFALPRRDDPGQPQIRFQLSDSYDRSVEVTSAYQFDRQLWQPFTPEPLQLGLTLYCRVDGSFAVCDPLRPDSQPRVFNFDTYSLWNGLYADKGDRSKVLCNGLIHDWVYWQNQPDASPFHLLLQVIQELAHPTEWMRPARPARLFVDDVRDMPMLETPYGMVPVTHASAGMKRILGLAYLLVWSWQEHLRIAEILRREPARNIVFLVDEVEGHLHPRWQRTILPSLMAVASALDPQIQVQTIATTHSPLVLASTEPWFDESRDRLFLLELQNQLVTLAEVPWAKQGDTVGWLTSEVFGLKQARSQEAEVAIEAAEAWMRGDRQYEFPATLHTPEQIHQELLRVLPGHDPFWARWIVRMERQQA
jgi:hypothetical protein